MNDMKKLQILLLFAIAFPFLQSCGRSESKAPKISIFCDHIETIARQEHISFAEAATLIRQYGYNGADVRVTFSPAIVKTLDSLGFEHACAIADINYSRGDQPEMEEQTLSFMDTYGYDRLLLIPGLMPSDGLSQEEREAVRQRASAFAARVAAKGYSVLIKDFDNPRSLCYGAERMDSLLRVSNDIGVVFDTGNFIFAGDDTMTQFGHFRKQIGHVHLKDRAAPDDMTCVPAGEGCIPMEEIIGKLKESGYEGWYTVEQYGSRKMLEDSRTSYDNVFSFLTSEK